MKGKDDDTDTSAHYDWADIFLNHSILADRVNKTNSEATECWTAEIFAQGCFIQS